MPLLGYKYSIVMSKSNKINFDLRDSSQRHIVFLELKLELRNFIKAIQGLHIYTNIKKFYLSYIIIGFLICLLNINPSAKGDNRLLTLANANTVLDNNPILFLSPSLLIPNVKAEDINSSIYSKYTIAPGETLEQLGARFDLNENSITINNPKKEIKEGVEIIRVAKNGYLVGFVKNTDFGELAKATGLSIEDINFQKNGKDDGYIFLDSDNPEQKKKEYEQALAKIRYKIPTATNIKLVQQSEGSVQNGADFSNSLVSFINEYKGTRTHDGKGWYYGECVSLVKKWQLYIGADSGVWPGNYPKPSYEAFLYGNRSMATSNANYNVMVVGDVNSLRPGDIVVMSSYTSHTGIATGNVSNGQFELLDQNSPVGSAVGFNNYPTSQFIGALRYIKN